MYYLPQRHRNDLRKKSLPTPHTQQKSWNLVQKPFIKVKSTVWELFYLGKKLIWEELMNNSQKFWQNFGFLIDYQNSKNPDGFRILTSRILLEFFKTSNKLALSVLAMKNSLSLLQTRPFKVFYMYFLRSLKMIFK